MAASLPAPQQAGHALLLLDLVSSFETYERAVGHGAELAVNGGHRAIWESVGDVLGQPSGARAPGEYLAAAVAG
jgi:hypothetical protein